MAQVYSYLYKGEPRLRQDKCKALLPLDKARIWLDFNEYCADDESSGAPIYLLSQADIVNDSEGNDVELCEGMKVPVFDNDLDSAGRPDALLAEGVVLRNFLAHYPHVKWLIQLTDQHMDYKSGAKYVYWLSDLQQAEPGGADRKEKQDEIH